jgi:hypothetical protein
MLLPQADVMRRLLMAAVAAPILLVPGTASAGDVSGTFQSATAGSRLQDPPIMASSATWRITGRPRGEERRLPVVVTQATRAPHTVPCTDTGPGTVSEYVSGPGTNPAGSFEFKPTMDLLRHRGKAYLRPFSDGTAGSAAWVHDQECPTFTVGNGITRQDVDSLQLFPAGVASYEAWLVRPGKGKDHSWHIDAVRQDTSLVSYAGAVRTEVHVTFSGLKGLAQCLLPTAKDLKRAHTFKRAAHVLRRAGFGKPVNGGHNHVPWVGRRHYWVYETEINPDFPCGWRKLTLYRS